VSDSLPRRQLLSSAEAVPAKVQHTQPCSDCPWARTALKGWLGGISIDEWIATAHSDEVVDCHCLTGAQCAGIAIYRRNVCKRADPPNLRLEVDREKVFAWPTEFKEHHSKMPGDP
jgi:hypothetical protein